jgi:hypothetical protein
MPLNKVAEFQAVVVDDNHRPSGCQIQLLAIKGISTKAIQNQVQPFGF